MTGPIALHGGGEFLPGDEPFLLALLETAREPAETRAAACGRAGPDEPVRIVLLPTAAAGHDPDASARLGTGAFERLAERSRRPVRVETARVVDAHSAEEPEHAARIAAADLVYLPGGDPAVIPAVLPDTAAWRSVLAARARGAVIAGASAGAMALGPVAWTPAGIVAALGIVRGLVVFPHADGPAWARQAAWFPAASAAGMGILGLGERTGIISTRAAPSAATETWDVVGEHEVRWLAPGSADPLVLRHGATLDLPA